MANYTATLSTSQTAASGVADQVTFDSDVGAVEVLNRDGAGEINFTLDGSAPTIGAANTYVVPAIAGAALKVDSTELAAAATVVKLIASVATKYTVTGLPG